MQFRATEITLLRKTQTKATMKRLMQSIALQISAYFFSKGLRKTKRSFFSSEAEKTVVQPLSVWSFSGQGSSRSLSGQTQAESVGEHLSVGNHHYGRENWGESPFPAIGHYSAPIICSLMKRRLMLFPLIVLTCAC